MILCKGYHDLSNSFAIIKSPQTSGQTMFTKNQNFHFSKIDHLYMSNNFFLKISSFSRERAHVCECARRVGGRGRGKENPKQTPH